MTALPMEKKLDALIARHRELGEKISNPDALKGGEFAKVSKEYSDLGPIVETALALKTAHRELLDAEAMLKDPEMRDMAEEEVASLKLVVPKLTHDLQVMLLPKDRR